MPIWHTSALTNPRRGRRRGLAIFVMWVLVGQALMLPLRGQDSGPDTGLLLGQRQVDEGDFERAAATLAAAIERLQVDAVRRIELSRAHLYQGIALLMLEQRERAKQSFKAALALDSGLRLRSDEFPPRVLQAFEQARREPASLRPSGAATRTVERPSATPSPAEPATRGGASDRTRALPVGVEGQAGSRVLVQTRFSGLAQGTFRPFDFTVPGAGELRITVRWTSSSNDLDLYLSTGSCASFPCSSILVYAASSGGSGQQLSSSVSPGEYRLWVRHFSGTPESGSVEVVLSSR